MAEARKVVARFSRRQQTLAAKTKKNLGKEKYQHYPVRDELWQLMKEKEREVILQARAYKDEIDWLLQAETLAVAALVEHHEKERENLIEALRFSRLQCITVMNKAGKRYNYKPKKVARVAGIKQHREVGGGNLMKKPARQR